VPKEEQLREGVSESPRAGELLPVDDPGLLIYERVLPALAASVARIRRELIETLARHDLAADRHPDIAVVVTEAASNAVVHAYRDSAPGPLYAAATLGGDSLTAWIFDFGRGMLPRGDSPGLGLGVTLMTRLCDRLQISPHADGGGTCVTAMFARPTRAGAHHAERRDTLTPGSGRREMLLDYLHAVRAANAAIRHDTDAVLAQADLAVARARRLRHQRA
jgi:serine/threonine-protein kinase RsbW/stage II sporulation protein AB (anti-sigma F factor)